MSLLAYIPPPPTNGIRVGPLFFHLYGLCIAVGILAAVSLARRRWAKQGRDPAELERAAFWGVVAGFVGGRLAYVSTHTGDFEGRWLHVVAVWEGGLALYGGLTLGIAVGVLVAWRQRLPVGKALDAAIPGIPLAQAFGRWGNYFNQELFGTPTRLPWALEVEPRYRPDRYISSETFHPTFLYESLFNLLVCGLLIWIGRARRLRTGSLVLCYAVLYATGRFFLELLRTDTTYRLAGLSRNAYVSIAVVLLGAAVLVWRERRAPGADQDQDEEEGAGAAALAAVAAATGDRVASEDASAGGEATAEGGTADTEARAGGAARSGAADGEAETGETATPGAGAADHGEAAAGEAATPGAGAADDGEAAAGGKPPDEAPTDEAPTDEAPADEAVADEVPVAGERGAEDGAAEDGEDAAGGTRRRRWQPLRRR
jgi:prolipoprotein diacylglyceryl transferase